MPLGFRAFGVPEGWGVGGEGGITMEEMEQKINEVQEENERLKRALNVIRNMNQQTVDAAEGKCKNLAAEEAIAHLGHMLATAMTALSCGVALVYVAIGDSEGKGPPHAHSE
jgi:hypothetical protein